MKTIIAALLIGCFVTAGAQNNYNDSIQQYLSKYVKEHEVVTGDNKKGFRFYAPNPAYRFVARFEKAADSKWFNMPTSGKIQKAFRIYGTLYFSKGDTAIQLPVYQSQSLLESPRYRDNLFLPFTDLTSGDETYASGRYLDLKLGDIQNGRVVLDFNKAYNPYCAYVTGKYNCPIPPRANQLPIAVMAGEKTFSGHIVAE